MADPKERSNLTNLLYGVGFTAVGLALSYVTYQTSSMPDMDVMGNLDSFASLAKEHYTKLGPLYLKIAASAAPLVFGFEMIFDSAFDYLYDLNTKK